LGAQYPAVLLFVFVLQREDKSCLNDVQMRRDALHQLVDRVQEMVNSMESIKK
jgi:uncharacterized protein YoxC